MARHQSRHKVIGKLKDNIAISADAVYTDESQLYKRMPENIQKHEIVNHSAKEWVRGDLHTCTIDGYWGLLKRGVIVHELYFLQELLGQASPMLTAVPRTDHLWIAREVPPRCDPAARYVQEREG